MTTPTDRLDELRIDRDDEGPRNPWVRYGILLALAVAIVALFVWWAVARDRAPAVRLAAATPVRGGAEAVSVLDASGYVTARRQATVSSKVTGKVVEVRVEEGQRVAEGEILARLDDSIPRRLLDLAEASARSAKSAENETAVLLAQAERDLTRAGNLERDGVVSASALEAAQAERDALEARLAAARDATAVAEREVALRRQELEDTRIRAPFDGVAISKDAQPGEMISPVSAGGGFTRTGVSTIVDMDSLEIEVDVNEAYIDRVEEGQKVVATLDAYPDWKIPAHVITSIPAADRQKATVLVRIGFDELGDPRILPDMGVKVSFRATGATGAGEEGGAAGEGGAAEGGAAHLVPASAIAREDGRDVVYVYRDGTVERRAVTAGPESGGNRPVRAGLRDGDRVVVEPPPGLADGDRVRLEEER